MLLHAKTQSWNSIKKFLKCTSIIWNKPPVSCHRCLIKTSASVEKMNKIQILKVFWSPRVCTIKHYGFVMYRKCTYFVGS